MSWIQGYQTPTPYCSQGRWHEFRKRQHPIESWHNMASTMGRRRQRHMRRKVLPHPLNINSNILQDILMGNVPYSYAHLMPGESRTPALPTSARDHVDIGVSYHGILDAAESNTMTTNHGSYFLNEDQNMTFPTHRKHTPMCGCNAVMSGDVGLQNAALEKCCEQSQPIDLSQKIYSNTLPPTCEKGSLKDFSMLRCLLLADKNTFEVDLNAVGAADPGINDNDKATVNSNTRVTLAKKNLLPARARVTDWLVDIVHFMITAPDFLSLSHHDQLTLLMKSWTRLLILYMAETNFQFVFTISPESSSNKPEGFHGVSHHIPTVKSVEAIQDVIQKCHLMKMDEKEYSYLRLIVVFNEGSADLEAPEVAHRLNSCVQGKLQQYIRVSRPNDVKHYPRLLMCLPTLCCLNRKMVENFFCSHITRKVDMNVILKDMVQTAHAQ